MTDMSIAFSGDNYGAIFHNDWDVCEANGLGHIEDLDGWYGGVGATVTPELKRVRRHGNFPAPTIRGPRKMDLTLTWVNSKKDPHGFSTWSRLLSAALWDEGPYAMTVREENVTLSCLVQLDGEIKHRPIVASSEEAFRVKIPLRANDPFLYGPAETYTVRPMGGGLALSYPLFGQAIADASGSKLLDWSRTTNESVTVHNPGNATAFPSYRIVADSPAGAVITANGQTVAYRGPIFPQSPLVIDMQGSASINGADYSSQLVARDWSSIPPGGFTTPSVSFPNGASGFAECIVRPTYI